MTFKHLIVLLPCQSLEYLSLERDSAEAEQLLSGWTALYTPAILAQAPEMPRWASADSPPEDVVDSLVVIPECSVGVIPPNWIETAEGAGARVIRHLQRRDEIIAAALEGVDGTDSLLRSPLAPDFLSLGFCHFEVELLTRQLRYMSNLDTDRFQRHARDAVDQLVQGDESAAREQLRGAFDRLTEAREYFYPVETHLVDLTLVAETTIGESLRRELASDQPINLLVSAAVVEQIAQREPGSLALLKESLESGRTTLVGGEYEERELPLMGLEELSSQIRRGLEVYQSHLGHRPTIFGRRRFGLTPMLPQVLKKFGFIGALHFTLDEGRFPTGNQSKIRWEGLDGTEIEALARIPVDAERPESFLRMASRLGNTLDADHAATAVFAHWPGRTGPWYEDLRRMGQYGPVLGRFNSLASYFQSTMYAGQSVRYQADKYRSPYLKQESAAGVPDPISRWADHHRREAVASDVQSIRTMMALVGGGRGRSPASRSPAAEPAPATAEADTQSCPGKDRAADELAAAAAGLAAAIKGPQVRVREGILVLNPRSHAIRLPVDVSHLDPSPEIARPVIAAGVSDDRRQVLLEVPAMGFAWVGPGTAEEPAGRNPRKGGKSAKDEVLAVEENQLRNEYFQVRVNPTTGALQSIQSYAVRGNRLAQQLAMRLPAESRNLEDPEAEENYSLMAADEIVATVPGPMTGRIVSRGRLMDRDGSRLARFVQTMTARRGSPILELDIELEVERLPEGNPWNSYYAARLAWTDETADVFQGVGLCRQPSEGKFLEAPHFIDIRSPRTQLTVLPGGLPYHRRYGLRKLDTLLVVPGETARRFRLGIGVDVKYPAHAAMDFLAMPGELVLRGARPADSWGWLFHLDARNVLATRWEPLFAEGKATGFRVRLLETEGRSVALGLRSFRPVASARKTDFLGEVQSELSVEEDQVNVEIGPREWIQVEVLFAAS